MCKSAKLYQKWGGTVGARVKLPKNETLVCWEEDPFDNNFQTKVDEDAKHKKHLRDEYGKNLNFRFEETEKTLMISVTDCY